jgi:hypothetical protein
MHLTWSLVFSVLLMPTGYSQSGSAIRAAAGTDDEWVKFQDPLERAFTVDVPRGWTVKGGEFRLGFSDHRMMVDLRSPDGKTNIRFGDVSIPVYAPPDQFHREGASYDLGAQAQLTAARYRTGEEFAKAYALTRFMRSCQSLNVQKSDPLPPDKSPPEEGVIGSSVGQITYQCVSGGQGPRIVYAYSKTLRYVDLWIVSAVVSFTTPPDQAALVHRILPHCDRTMQWSPEWIRMQKKMDADALEYQRARQRQRMADLSRQVQQFEAKMQGMRNQVQAFQRQQSAQAAQVEGFTNVLAGVTPTTDPLTGENRKVNIGPKSGYWTNGLGDVRNSNSSPGPGWRQLTEH